MGTSTVEAKIRILVTSDSNAFKALQAIASMFSGSIEKLSECTSVVDFKLNTDVEQFKIYLDSHRIAMNTYRLSKAEHLKS